MSKGIDFKEKDLKNKTECDQKNMKNGLCFVCPHAVIQQRELYNFWCYNIGRDCNFVEIKKTKKGDKNE